jgi:hypothetical protein
MLSFAKQLIQAISGYMSLSGNPTVDTFRHVTDPTLDVDISAFLTLLLHGVLVAPDPEAARNRFSVNSIDFQKHTAASSQPEFLSVQVFDRHNPSSPLQIFIERTTPGDVDSDYIFQHPDKTAPKTILEVAREPQPLASTLPLLSGATHPPPFRPSSIDTSSPFPSQLSVVDAASPTFIHGWNQLLAKSDRYAAHDHVLGVDKKLVHGQTVRHIVPEGLNLLDLALLADVVHNQKPSFSLFRNQSCWYADLICHAVQSICSRPTGVREPERPEDVCTPLNTRLPDLSGQGMGIYINKLEDVISSVCSEFQIRRREYIALVGSQSILNIAY